MAGGYFGSLAPWLVERLSALGFVSQPLAAELAYREGAAGTILTSWCSESDAGDSLRAVRIESPRVEIFNAMLFPSPLSGMPILACEMLVLAAKPVVAVIDLQDPAGNRTPFAAAWGQRLQARISYLNDRLTTGGELPDWARAHFSLGCLYARPSAFDELGFICEAFHETVNLWIEANGSKVGDAAWKPDDLLFYKQHHIKHVPALPFMKKIFGEAWAERYMRQFLYG